MNNPRPQYIIDANIFMEAGRRYYPLDFAKPFWDGLFLFAQQGRILSIDKVCDEIEKGNDLLKQWALDVFHPYFETTNTIEIIKSYSELVNWCAAQVQYNQNAKDRFMEAHNADTWVLAYAKTHGCIIVTSEVLALDSKKNIPIPNVCQAFKIPYCDTFEMLRRLNFSF